MKLWVLVYPIDKGWLSVMKEIHLLTFLFKLPKFYFNSKSVALTAQNFTIHTANKIILKHSNLIFKFIYINEFNVQILMR